MKEDGLSPTVSAASSVCERQATLASSVLSHDYVADQLLALLVDFLPVARRDLPTGKVPDVTNI